MALEAAGPARVGLAVAVARGHDVDEALEVTTNGVPLLVEALDDGHGGVFHRFETGPGRLEIAYRATVHGQAPIAPMVPIDNWRYLRPSRYAESDELGPFAVGEFGGLWGFVLVDAVTSWVNANVTYESGSSQPTDGATQTLLSRRGVCRDFAHLVVALLRALDIPSRVVSVYAPGLYPMDFHAVAEVLVDGAWYIVDATGLAPRQSLIRIATGRDAADTAFLTNHGAELELLELEVLAVVDELPFDDLSKPVVLR
jgi:transglutaminase-like putative cysteine protease